MRIIIIAFSFIFLIGCETDYCEELHQNLQTNQVFEGNLFICNAMPGQSQTARAEVSVNLQNEMASLLVEASEINLTRTLEFTYTCVIAEENLAFIQLTDNGFDGQISSRGIIEFTFSHICDDGTFFQGVQK